MLQSRLKTVPLKCEAGIARILFVDDDPKVLKGYQRNLRKRFSMVSSQLAEGLYLQLSFSDED